MSAAERSRKAELRWYREAHAFVLIMGEAFFI
jgi:hypothetical protein